MEQAPTPTSKVGRRRVSRARPPLTILALGVAVGLTVGCTPTPAPTPTGSTAAASTPVTSTSSPTSTARTENGTPPTDPGIPAAAREDSIEGAQAFVTYFIQRANESWTRPDPALLAPLCMASSKTCAALTERARELETARLHYVGTPYQTTPVIGASWSPGAAIIRATGGQPDGRVVDDRGATVQTLPSSQVTLVFELVMDSQWRVLEIKTEAPPT